MSDLVFCDLRTQNEWEATDPGRSLFAMTREVVVEGLRYSFERWGWLWTVTSIYRTPQEDKLLGGTGVHPAWRAVDIRSRGVSDAWVCDLAAYLNGLYVYDVTRPSKPVAYCQPHGNGPHIHVQAHPKTVRRDLFNRTA